MSLFKLGSSGPAFVRQRLTLCHRLHHVTRWSLNRQAHGFALLLGPHRHPSLTAPRCLVAWRFYTTAKPAGEEETTVSLAKKDEALVTKEREDEEAQDKSRFYLKEHIGGRKRYVSFDASGKLSLTWENAAVAKEGVHAEPRRGAGAIATWFKQMFLPVGYPRSVHPAYLRYHVWQFFETCMHALVSVLCNQALLESIGASSTSAAAGAVAIQWIIKDGAGEVAKLFFIRHFAPYFDSHPKSFKFMGETCVALGSGLQLASLLVQPTPTNFLICAASGNVFKLVGYAIWGTTHIKFVRYFAKEGNMGDVAAKHEAQSSVAQLVGWTAGIGLLAVSHSAAFLYGIFFLAVPFHLTTTALMLKAATFELLTLPRLTVLCQKYMETKTVCSLEQLNASHALGLFGEFAKRNDRKSFVLGSSFSDIIQNDEQRVRWEEWQDVTFNERYLLYMPPLSLSAVTSPDPTLIPPIYIFLHPKAEVKDIMKSYLHGVRLRHCLQHAESTSLHDYMNDVGAVDPQCEMAKEKLSVFEHAALVESYRWTNKEINQFLTMMGDAKWRVQEVGYADHGHRLEWRQS